MTTDLLPPKADGRAYSTEDLYGPLVEHERKYAPEELYVFGELDLLRSAPRVSIVGSRSATRKGLVRAATLTARLVEQGVTIVSGLADGIDTAAHKTAIREGGRTIAVIGTPLDVAYPKKNAELQAEIAEDHLLVSQFKPGTRTYPSNFPQRNRTMALLSDATVIVEAGEKSGTIHQGWEALRLGRRLLIMDSLYQVGFDWVDTFIGYGAEVLSQSNFEAFVEDLPLGRFLFAEPF